MGEKVSGENGALQGGGAEVRRIPAGAEVAWSSQSGGYVRTKRGRVVAFVPRWPKGDGGLEKYVSAEAWPNLRAQRTAMVDRYLVEVPRDGKRGPLPPLHYAPFASVLEAQNPRRHDNPTPESAVESEPLTTAEVGHAEG